MNSIREIEKINQQELERGISGTPASWHAQYANSAWCYVGNLDHQLTEGDLICIMSQYGEIEDVHLVREEDTGKSRGFGFIKYEDSRSCVLAVDNFVGAQILGRSLRVDHVEQYRLPKKLQEQEEARGSGNHQEQQTGEAGHAYKGMELENHYNVKEGVDLFAPTSTTSEKSKNDHDTDVDKEQEERQKRKEERRRKREEKEERRRRREEKKRRKRAHGYGDEDNSDDGQKKSGTSSDTDNSRSEKERHRRHKRERHGHDHDRLRRKKEETNKSKKRRRDESDE
jgi:RNA-binding motif X-linked protein 2